MEVCLLRVQLLLTHFSHRMKQKRLRSSGRGSGAPPTRNGHGRRITRGTCSEWRGLIAPPPLLCVVVSLRLQLGMVRWLREKGAVDAAAEALAAAAAATKAQQEAGAEEKAAADSEQAEEKAEGAAEAAGQGAAKPKPAVKVTAKTVKVAARK